MTFQSLGEGSITVMLCGIVCHQHDMSAVTLFSKACQVCHLAAIAASSSRVCRLNVLQNLAGGMVLGTAAVLSILLLSCAIYLPD